MSVDRVFTVWTVYESPSDFPGWWVLRAHDVVPGQPEPIPREEWHAASSLEQVRVALPPGLTCLPRQPDDDPVIYETWI